VQVSDTETEQCSVRLQSPETGAGKNLSPDGMTHAAECGADFWSVCQGLYQESVFSPTLEFSPNKYLLNTAVLCEKSYCFVCIYLIIQQNNLNELTK